MTYPHNWHFSHCNIDKLLSSTDWKFPIAYIWFSHKRYCVGSGSLCLSTIAFSWPVIRLPKICAATELTFCRRCTGPSASGWSVCRPCHTEDNTAPCSAAGSSCHTRSSSGASARTAHCQGCVSHSPHKHGSSETRTTPIVGSACPRSSVELAYSKQYVMTDCGAQCLNIKLLLTGNDPRQIWNKTVDSVGSAYPERA